MQKVKRQEVDETLRNCYRFAEDETLQKYYRFADKADEVNWNARYKPNQEFLAKLIPLILSFTDSSIRKVIDDKTSLRALVTISGGLDSSVSTMLAAEAMRKAKNNGSVKSTSLILLAFKGISDEDLEYARRFGNFITSSYTDLPVYYQESDLTPLLRAIDDHTEELVVASTRQKLYAGGLTTRLINLVGLEVSDKIGHCFINTTNGTEVVLGEFVIGAGGEYAPLVDFYKSRVYDIGELIGIPKFVLERPPINSTYGTDKIHTYFGEIPAGLTPRDVYAVLDPVLYLIYNKGFKPRTIAKGLGHSEKFVKNVYEKVKAQEHRREIPFFSVKDRTIRLKRTIETFTNEEIENFIEDSYNILRR